MKSLLAILISSALVVSGYSQTRNVLVNTNNVVIQPTNFWSADASNARVGLGLGSAATNPASAFQPSSATLSNLASSNAVNLTNLRATNIVGTIPASNIPTTTLTNISGTLAIVSGGTGATNAATARTNLELGASWLTNTVASNFRTAIGLPWNNLTNNSASNFFQQILTNSDESAYPRIPATQLLAAGSSFGGIDPTNYTTGLALKYVSTPDDGYGGIPSDHDTWTVTSPSKFRSAIGMSLPALTNVDNSSFRSAIGLSFSALTNTNVSGFNASLYGSNTNPVLVNTNGEVVSPTNFWQAAPIVAKFIETQPATNSTTNLVGARLLHIHSLAISIGGVTNTIVLPTNGTSFAGDIALVVHQGPTNSMTRVRQAGSTNDLITMTRFDEAVELVYYENDWQLNHNVAFVEPIYFAGTNTVANAAASRTNLGLGATNNVVFNNIEADGFLDAVNVLISTNGTITFYGTNSGFAFSAGASASQFREDLGLPLAALTNTNNANFQAAIFTTNSAPTNSANVNTVNFNTAIHWMEVNVVTNGVTNNFRIPLFK